MTGSTRFTTSERIAHERRVIRRLEARGDRGLGDALIQLDTAIIGNRYQIESLYAVGSEGAVYLCRDLQEPDAPVRVAKTALLPLHRPFDLTDEEIRRRRDLLREEASNLAAADSRYMPRSLGLFEFPNPALDAEWGGEFAAPEPVIVMEKLPGFDLDVWLARMHSSSVPRNLLRRQLDHVAVVVLSGLMDLQDRGFFYTDLRPGNVRIRGRSRERVRLLDAGSLVRVSDRSGKFPHVPAYLPPEMFEKSRNGGILLPSPSVQAVMAGRTLYEVATGHVPLPGEKVDPTALRTHCVSPAVAETVSLLCTDSFPDVMSALAYLSERFLPERDDRVAKPKPVARAAVRPAAVPAQSPAASAGGPGSSPASSRPAGTPPLDLRSALAKARPAPNAPAPLPGHLPIAQSQVGRRTHAGDARRSRTGDSQDLPKPDPAPSRTPAPAVPAMASAARNADPGRSSRIGDASSGDGAPGFRPHAPAGGAGRAPAAASPPRSASEANLRRLYASQTDDAGPATPPITQQPASSRSRSQDRPADRLQDRLRELSSARGDESPAARSAAEPGPATPRPAARPDPRAVPESIARADTETATIDASPAQFRQDDDRILPEPRRKPSGWIARILAWFRRR